MYRLGLDIGSSTIKAVLMRDDVIEQAEIVHHYGDLLNGLVEIFTKIKYDDVCKMSVTGSNSRIMEDMLPSEYFLGDIPAIAEGTKFLCPNGKIRYRNRQSVGKVYNEFRQSNARIFGKRALRRRYRVIL